MAGAKAQAASPGAAAGARSARADRAPSALLDGKIAQYWLSLGFEGPASNDAQAESEASALRASPAPRARKPAAAAQAADGPVRVTVGMAPGGFRVFGSALTPTRISRERIAAAVAKKR